MRILHCLRAPAGGLFRHVLDLASEQAKRGHDVGIVADSNAKDRLTDSKFATVAPSLTLGILRAPMWRNPGLGDFAAARTVMGHARPLKLDVLHGHGAKGGAYARLAARQLKREGQSVKAFYTPHGGTLNFKPGTLETRVFLKLERVLERFTDGLIFESAFAARIYKERVSAAGVPQRIIPNGLQPDDFIRPDPDAAATDVLFVGELRHLKGVDVLLKAIAELNKTRRVTATIVGTGPDETELESFSAALGLENAVVFTGALPAREAFRLGRIMIVPSRAESFPYIVLEAAAAGLPLIATSAGGIPEIVYGTNTALIEPGATQPLIDALNAVLDDPEAASARAKNLRANVAEKFTVAAMTSAVLGFYALTSR